MVLSLYLLLFVDADYIFTSTGWVIGKILPHMSLTAVLACCFLGYKNFQFMHVLTPIQELRN